MRNRFGFAGISMAEYGQHVRSMAYNIGMQDDDQTAVIDLEGYIGRDLFMEWMTGEKSKNTAENFRRELRALDVQKIIVNIHSPGGDLSEGLVIKNLLQAKRAEVVTNLMGLSASAATAVLNGGTTRRMAKNTSFMLIHRAMLGVMGFFNQNSTKAMTEDLETIDNQIIQMYAAQATADEQEIADLMDEGEGYGKWIDPDQALEMGLIDEIYDPGDTEDEDIDRLENRKRAVQNLTGVNIETTLEAFLSRKPESGKSEEELQNEAASVREARCREVDTEIEKITNEVPGC